MYNLWNWFQNKTYKVVWKCVPNSSNLNVLIKYWRCVRSLKKKGQKLKREIFIHLTEWRILSSESRNRCPLIVASDIVQSLQRIEIQRIRVWCSYMSQATCNFYGTQSHKIHTFSVLSSNGLYVTGVLMLRSIR